MRIVHWLFVVSVALFVSGIGFVVAGARTTRLAPAADVPVTTPVASIKQIMNGIVAPAATVVYNAVGTFVSAEGVKEVAPQNDEEWAAVGTSAATPALKAAEAKSTEGILAAGSEINDTCDNCHAKYQRQ